MYWWVALGYPDTFEMGKDGFPRPGQVVKYYRERTKDEKGKTYTQSALSCALGISEHAVRDLENRDIGMDHKKRQFLCGLFNIPPILFGIRTLDEILLQVEQEMKARNAVTLISTPKRTGVKLVIDVREYRSALRSYRATDESSTAYGMMSDVQFRIDTLYRELPHVKDEKPELQELLCDYHSFVAILLKDQQKYDDSIAQIDKALFFAESLGNAEIKVLTLHRRGNILTDAERIDEAMSDYTEARQYEDQIPNYLKGPVLFHAGLAEAIGAKTKDQKAKDEAISLIDRGGKIVRVNSGERPPYFLDFSLVRYHLNKGSALIAIGKNQDAIDELKLVKGGTAYARRQAYKDILLAQAHANSGEYNEAARVAVLGLVVVQEIDSVINIARVEKIYREKLVPYKKNPEVAHLAYLLHG